MGDPLQAAHTLAALVQRNINHNQQMNTFLKRKRKKNEEKPIFSEKFWKLKVPSVGEIFFSIFDWFVTRDNIEIPKLNRTMFVL